MRTAALAGALLAAACAARAPEPACRAREALLANRGRVAVEQVYQAPDAEEPTEWGRDLLGDATLAPTAGMPLRLNGPGRLALRVIWVNGRAAELRGLDGCSLRAVTVTEATLRAE